MDSYTIRIELPIRARDDRAAAAAQLLVYQQLQLILCRGIVEDDFEVPVPQDIEFPAFTRAVKGQPSGENLSG